MNKKTQTNKKWYEKASIWIAIIAGIVTIIVGIFTISGVSIFGGISLLNLKKGDDSTTNSENMEEKYSKGTITKTGWESKFIGLRYINPDGMNMSTEEELDEMSEFKEGTPSIVFDQEELGRAALTTEIEMESTSDDKSVIVGICVDRLIDEADIFEFIDFFKSQMYRNPFVNYTLISDNETVKIGNDNYILVSYMTESNSIYRYQDSYFRIVGDRIIMISFNFNDERAKDNILNCFTAY